nr:hypothetical protein CFP56_65766 [Quercus suber]
MPWPWQHFHGDVPSLGCCMPWPWLRADGAALALAACPWRRALALGVSCLGLRAALALAATCLGLGCLPMGLPWLWQHAHRGWLNLGCMPWPWWRAHGGCLGLDCKHALLESPWWLPWPWLRANEAALDLAACLVLSYMLKGGYLSLGCCMPWTWQRTHGDVSWPWLLHVVDLTACLLGLPWANSMPMRAVPPSQNYEDLKDTSGQPPKGE